MENDVIIIGGGASGLMAGITAARNHKKVVILEHLDKVGKKLLATGNGKCNYTNLIQEGDCYRGNNPSFVCAALDIFGPTDAIAFFKEIGIYPRNKQGYLYPNSEQATAVRDCLLMECKRVGVKIHLNVDLIELKKVQEYFQVSTIDKSYIGRNLIIATGLLAGKNCGCDGSIFPYIKQFGHHFIDIVPALVQLKANQSYLNKLAGIRSQVSLELLVDNKVMGQDQGELLFTKNGLSGIVVMQVSRYASRGLLEKKKIDIRIRFLPTLSTEEVDQELKSRIEYNPERTYGELLIGLLPSKVAEVIIQKAKLDLHHKVENERSVRETLVQAITQFKVPIIGTKELSDGQVCAGGVNTAEVDPATMMSRKVPNLFFTGEVLDVDGICGGYNLQWAWASGYVAGQKVLR